MRKPIENIRQEWSGLRKVREELQKDYKDWKKLEQKATQVFELLKAEMGWDVALHIQDKMPEAREIRFTLHHVFPLGDELVGYNNSATLVFEQRLSGQIFVWHLFPQKEHFTRYEGLQARPAGQFKVDLMIEDETLLFFQVESFLQQLKGWMLEVLPEPAEEKTATEF